jgi:NhaP-type Na+/H+ or K+/H+ antiporter
VSYLFTFFVAKFFYFWSVPWGAFCGGFTAYKLITLLIRKLSQMHSFFKFFGYSILMGLIFGITCGTIIGAGNGIVISIINIWKGESYNVINIIEESIGISLFSALIGVILGGILGIIIGGIISIPIWFTERKEDDKFL